MIKIIAHETKMDIPIFNSLYLDDYKTLKQRKLTLIF